ncbi:unnamed protein product [Cylindrotheca closterium]|uniref:Uncharacterized protein n=1 Tax=Cylindrotheca closterium TaxID=2856 RepID=A0AAD2FJX5_9STRA|nr:unnamed protein product [Cylindrotheca closterium]
MKFSKSLLAVVALASAPGVSAFAPASNGQAKTTSLNMINEESMKKAATTFAAAAFLMSNVAAAAPAFAVDDMDFGSTQVIAARSGGRAGGRSSARAPSRAPSRSAPSRSTTVINRSTYIAPPVYSSPVYVAPYNPMPGLGLSFGLNAMNQIGNDMRDYRQEGEIRDTRSELMRSQAREAEMEARLRQLEAQQQGQLSAQQQQQLMMQMQQQQMLQQQAK